MRRASENNVQFGKRLQLLRQRTGKSAIQVAREVGVAPSTYRDWEQGRAITGQPYLALAAALNLNVADLFIEERLQVSEIHRRIDELSKALADLRRML